MMPEEWPIAAPAADGSVATHARGADRLSTVRVDFFLDPAKRLTEQERALMSAMLHQLIRDVGSAIKAALPEGWPTANDQDDTVLAERLSNVGLLDEPGLIALLLRRADEERISLAARARGGRREARVLQGLVSNDQGAVAAAAMALILGRGRRRDRFGQALISLDDLADASASHLLSAVAAALREELAANRGAPIADRELASATRSLANQRDSARSLAALTMVLLSKLDEAGALTDELVLAAAQEGEVGFVAAMLAHRAGVSFASAMEELLSGDAKAAMTLFRAATSSRELVAGMLASIGDLLGLPDTSDAIATFDGLGQAEVDARRSLLAADPEFRNALEQLSRNNG